MQQPLITIFCAFTRRWAVEGWLENLKSSNIDPARTNLAVIVDIDDPYILRATRMFAEEHGYRNFYFRMNEHHYPNEVRLSWRRLRIAEVKNQSKELIAKSDGEIIIGLEDDTVFPNLDIHKLIDPIIGSDQVGFVEGVQCGRHNLKMIGAWDANDFLNPTEAHSLFPAEGYQQISAGGFYGYATRRSLYLNHEYYSASSQPYGPDVNFGLWVRQQGYKCLVDWDLNFGHNDHGRILMPDGKLVSVHYTKDTTTGRWSRSDVER